MVETINAISLSKMKNALYAQFMADIDFQILRVTPEALKIKSCYSEFSAGRERLDKTFVTQRKDNRTAEMSFLDFRRNRCYSCALANISADLMNVIEEKQSAAQILRNKFDAYGYLPSLGYNEESAKMSDLCNELKVAPYAELIGKIGLTAEIKVMEEINEAFITLSRERTESSKSIITEEMKATRADLDDKYRNMINVINSQVTINALMDGGGEEERPGELSNLSDPLADIVQSINALVKEYKTKMAQSSSGNKPGGGDERPGEL